MEHRNNIKSLRIARGLSQTDVANILGLNTAAVSKKERGDRALKPHEIQILAARWNVSESEILGKNPHALDMQEHHHAPTADAKLVCEAVRITEEHIAVRGYKENKEAKQCMVSLIFEILKEQSASGYRYHLGETILDMAAEKAGYKK